MLVERSLLIADDHPLLRKGLAALIKQNLVHLDILEANDGIDAWKKLKSGKIDIAILDISMPGHSGLDILRLLHDKQILTKCIILTLHKDRSFYIEAKKLGAVGYLLKEYAEEEIVLCVTEVLAGKEWKSRNLEEDLQSSQIDSKLSILSRAEIKVVQLIAQERTSREIANLLFIAEKTVENHRSNICRKLKLDNKPNVLLSWVLMNKGKLT